MIGINSESSDYLDLIPLILGNINDLVCVIKPTYPFEIELINEKVFLNCLGFSNEELIFQSILDFVHPDDVKIISESIDKEEFSFDILEDIRLKEKSGEYILFKMKSKVFKNSKNQLKIIIILKDNSHVEELEHEIKEKDERFKELTNKIPEIRFWKLFSPKKYEIALQNSYDMLQRVMDNIPENIFWKDENLIYLGCNQNYAKLISKESPENIIGKKDEEIFFDKNKTEYLNKREKYIINSDLPEFHIIEEWITQDGAKIWLDINRIPLHDSKGKSAGILVTCEDITKKLIEREKLIESEEKFKILAEQSLMGIAILDENSLKYINNTISLITEYSIEELLGKSLSDLKLLTNPRDHHSVKKFLNEDQLKTKHKRSLSFRIISKSNKEKWIELFSNPIFYKGAFAKLLIIFDITEKKEVEKLIIEENIKLLELDQMRKNLITRVSHELKTPLISIFSGSELLLDHYKDKLSSESLEIIELINRGGKRLKDLIDNFIDISRVESNEIILKKKKENIVKIINECIVEIENLVKKRDLSLQFNITNDLFLNIDRIRIKQVLNNLISNAIKNTPSKGKILIDIKESLTHIDIIIKDTGVGLTKNELNQIFKKFGKIERDGRNLDVDPSGSGLGLYYSKKIIELHDGEILVESEGRHRGAKFIIRITNN